MMMESIGPAAGRQQSDAWRRHAWLLVVAGALLIVAVALAWWGARLAAIDERQLARVGELQLAARDISALSSLAASGEQAVLTRLRDRSAYLQSTLAALISGGEHNGELIAAADEALQGRLRAFATEWADFERRTVAALSAPGSAEAPAAKRAAPSRSPEKRAPAPAGQKSAAPRAGRASEPGISAVSLLGNGNALAGRLDDIRSDLDVRARTPWSLYLAAACAVGAMIALAAYSQSVWRSGQALQRSAEQSNAALVEALRPAMRTLQIHADATADPQALGERLSNEILSVVDGVKTLVKALDAAAAEADKFAVLGHVAAQALAAAEQKAADTGSSVQATARRISAVYAAVGAGANDVQNQCTRVLELMRTGSPATKNAVRATDRLRESMESLVGSYARTVAMQSEITQGLLEVADLLTQAEGFALRASDRLANAAGGEAVAFANEVRGALGRSVAILKQTTELVRGAGREADDFSTALARMAADAGEAARTGLDGTSALDGVGLAVQELSAKIAAVSRIASGSEASQLLSALDEIVRQTAESSASARQVLDATHNAASHIEELAKLLNTMKPS